MLLKIGMVLAAVPMSLLAVVAGTGVVVVDVQERGPAGHHIVVPVPLVLAQVAATFAPHGKDRIELGEAQRYLPMAEEMVQALRDAPDGELVRVEERDQKVRIAKVGANLEIKVTQGENREDVSVTIPLAMARTLVREARNGSLRAPAIVAALREARLTTLADVRDGDEHVRVTIW
jgi:hypothetical protein